MKKLFLLMLSFHFMAHAFSQRWSIGDYGLLNQNILSDTSYYFNIGFSFKNSFRIYPSEDKLYEKDLEVYVDLKPYAGVLSSNQFLGGIGGIRIRYHFGSDNEFCLFKYCSPRKGWSAYYRNGFLFTQTMNNFKKESVIKGFNYHEIGYTSDEFILTFNLGLYYMKQASTHVFGLTIGFAEKF